MAFCIDGESTANACAERLPRLSDSIRLTHDRQPGIAAFVVVGAPWGGWAVGLPRRKRATQCEPPQADPPGGRGNVPGVGARSAPTDKPGKRSAQGRDGTWSTGVRGSGMLRSTANRQRFSEHRRRLARRLQEQGLHNARYAGSVATGQTPRRERATGASACA
jgi:hypothetical protein